MVDLTNRAEVLQLLSELELVKNKLTSNELEMFKQIQAVYKEADMGAFDDKICLEVMLRNVAIREGYRMDKKDAVRVIELERKNEDGVKQ